MTATEFHDRVQELRQLYPDGRSAIMGALHLAQRRHEGWLPVEALEEVADAMELTPAFVQSVASFYDMYHLEPVGRHEVAVCTNVSCALAGAQDVLEAFERELGVEAGGTTEDGEFSLSSFECLGGCGWATVVAVNWRYREHVQAGDVPGIVAELRGGRPEGGADDA